MLVGAGGEPAVLDALAEGCVGWEAGVGGGGDGAEGNGGCVFCESGSECEESFLYRGSGVGVSAGSMIDSLACSRLQRAVGTSEQWMEGEECYRRNRSGTWAPGAMTGGLEMVGWGGAEGDGGLCRQRLRRAGCGAGCGGLPLPRWREAGNRLGGGGDVDLRSLLLRPVLGSFGAFGKKLESWRAGELDVGGRDELRNYMLALPLASSDLHLDLEM